MKILIVRFSSIGDIILTTPVIRCVKKQLGAEVHFLTKSSFRQILESNPYLSKIYTIKKSVNEVVQLLKQESYDCVIDLHKNLRTLDLRKQLFCKTYTFDKANISKWCMVNLKWDFLPKKHIVERYLDSVKPLGVVNDGKGLDIFLRSSDEVDLLGLELKTNQFIVLIVGAAHYTKQIPVEKCVELIDELPSCNIVLLGGKGDIDKSNQILELSKKTIVNLTGKLSLMQSAYIVDQSSLVITPDTGMMHIAAALGKKITVLWGSTVPEFGMYPYLVEHINAEVSSVACRPCSKIGNTACPKEHFNCMMKQDVGNIVEKAKSYIV